MQYIDLMINTTEDLIVQHGDSCESMEVLWRTSETFTSRSISVSRGILYLVFWRDVVVKPHKQAIYLNVDSK